MFDHHARDIENLMWERAAEQGRQLVAGGLTYAGPAIALVHLSEPGASIALLRGFPIVAAGGICAPLNVDYSIPIRPIQRATTAFNALGDAVTATTVALAAVLDEA